jgi:hypothetical protein
LKDRTYLTGLILIVITFIACVISFWLLVYCFIIFLVGVLLVWLSKKSVKTKIFSTVLPIIFYVPATYLFLLAYNYTTPKTFLIPADLEGTIRIVYEEKCGVKLYKENGRQLLQFPESGILILNEKFDGGINNEYFLVDKNGKRTKVEQSIDYKDKPKKLPFILVGGAGTIGGDEKDKGITFSDFDLYNKDTIQIEDYKQMQRLDSITTEIVRACRTK